MAVEPVQSWYSRFHLSRRSISERNQRNLVAVCARRVSRIALGRQSGRTTYPRDACRTRGESLPIVGRVVQVTRLNLCPEDESAAGVCRKTREKTIVSRAFHPAVHVASRIAKRASLRAATINAFASAAILMLSLTFAPLSLHASEARCSAYLVADLEPMENQAREERGILQRNSLDYRITPRGIYFEKTRTTSKRFLSNFNPSGIHSFRDEELETLFERN